MQTAFRLELRNFQCGRAFYQTFFAMKNGALAHSYEKASEQIVIKLMLF